MVILFVDTTRSTDVVGQYGHEATEHIRSELAAVSMAFAAVPGTRQLGARLGDGMLLVNPDEGHAVDLVRAALRLQSVPRAFLLRIGLGVGEALWDGPEDGPTSTVNGPVVTLVARLLDHCPSGGVVITTALHERIAYHAPDLRDRIAVLATAVLKGLGSTDYWVTTSRSDDLQNRKPSTRRRLGDPETLDPTRLRENGEVSITRQGLRISGPRVVTLTLILGLITAVGYVATRGESGDKEMATVLRDRIPASKAEHDAILRALTANTEALRDAVEEAKIQTWLLSQPADSRPRLVAPSGLAGRLAPGRPNR